MFPTEADEVQGFKTALIDAGVTVCRVVASRGVKQAIGRAEMTFVTRPSITEKGGAKKITPATTLTHPICTITSTSGPRGPY